MSNLATSAYLSSIRGRLCEGLLNWDLDIDEASAHEIRVRSRRIGGLRVADISGRHCTGYRGPEHCQLDGGGYFAVSCTLEGSVISRSSADQLAAAVGDIVIWHNDQRLRFDVADFAHTLVLLVPEARFHSHLHSALPYHTWMLRSDSSWGAIISGYMRNLSEHFERLDDHSAECAIDSTLDMVGAAIGATLEAEHNPRRTPLYERIVRYLERRLEDDDLTPARIAAAHGISKRYLHLLFADRGQTVSGWMRERRLLRCRAEIESPDSQLPLTKIAYQWGFSDPAHFSRAFKERFGVSPRAWRERCHRDRAQAERLTVHSDS